MRSFNKHKLMTEFVEYLFEFNVKTRASGSIATWASGKFEDLPGWAEDGFSSAGIKLTADTVFEITDSDDFDYLFVGMNDFINKKLPLQDSIDWGVENLNKVTEGGDYFLFDGSDSTSLMGSIEVLEQSNAIYLFKNQLLKREEYKKPSY